MNNKKKSIFLLSAFIMSLMSVSNANAAEIDISSLNKVILAKNQATESDDINSDNIIDIFDSIELRKIYMKRNGRLTAQLFMHLVIRILMWHGNGRFAKQEKRL